MLTRDEERNLPRALSGLPHGMPVFVLDAESDDRTVEFARDAGATVVVRHWIDFVEARRFAIAQVRTPWTLVLDADEALDDRLRDAILACDEKADGYTLARDTYFCGKPLRQWRDERLLRLFRSGSARVEARPASGGTAALHERFTIDGRVEFLPGTLLHFSYPDVASYRVKFRRYTRIEAAAGGGGSSAVALLLLLPRFLRTLFARGALLDGWRGWYVAWMSALYPLAVAATAARS